MTTEDAPPLTRRARRARERAVAGDATRPTPGTTADDTTADAAGNGADATGTPSGAEAAHESVTTRPHPRPEPEPDPKPKPEPEPDPKPEPEPEPTADSDIESTSEAAAPPAPVAVPVAVSGLATPGILPPVADDEDAAIRADEESTAGPRRTPRRLALTWVDEDAVAAASPGVSLDTAATPYVTVQPDLLAVRPRRSPLRAGVLVPLLSIIGVIVLYAATTLLWPLHAVAPQVTTAELAPVSAPASAPAWPVQGGAALGVQGITGAAASTGDPISMASLTKVVTVLMALDRMPLAVGEQGPEYGFTAADQSSYWRYRERGESALPVPVDGTLTQYQLMQGILIASANNYADRLAADLWPSDQVFADAAAAWLSQRGLTGMTVVDPSGIDEDNVADPASLIALADLAMADPVVAEIVRMPTAELPGAGLIENTNALLADPGVVGIKTGALWEHFNLLVAKDLVVDETPVRMYAAVMAQGDGEARNAVARALLAQLESELQARPTVAAGTVAGSVTTAWGADTELVTADATSVVLWNGASAPVTADVSLEDGADARTAGAAAGTLTVTGPLDSDTVEVRLASDLPGPTAWWRLTHPLELFGLAG